MLFNHPVEVVEREMCLQHTMSPKRIIINRSKNGKHGIIQDHIHIFYAYRDYHLRPEYKGYMIHATVSYSQLREQVRL